MTVNASGTVTDVLGAATTDGLAVSEGDARDLDVVVHYLHKNRPNFNSLVDVPRQGPAVLAVETDEVGLNFDVQVSCTLTGARIYKHPEAASVTVSVWNTTTRQQLGTSTTVSWAGDTDGGWRELDLDTPVALSPGAKYTISYFTNAFAYTTWRFNAQEYYEWPFHVMAGEIDNGDGTKIAAGCYLTGSHGFPATNTAAWYWVDPRVEYASQVETYKGGFDYFKQWPNCGIEFFPISVFAADTGTIVDYASIGVNMIQPWDIAEARDEVVSSGATVIATADESVARLVVSDPELGALVKAYNYWDEPDLQGTGNGTAAVLRDKFISVRNIDSSRPLYFGFGYAMLRGQSFSWFPSGAGADVTSAMWRQQATLDDIVNGDDYSIGDGSGIWQYGMQTDRLRDINDARTPVWATIETCIIDGVHQVTAEQSHKAAMLSIIHGARGIVWFDHQFPQSTPDGTTYPQDFQVILHDEAKRDAYVQFHEFLQSIKGALWAPESSTYTVTVDSSNKTAGPVGGELGVPIHTTVREDGGTVYLLAQAARPGATTGTFTILGASGATVTVLGESRTLTGDDNGTFTDAFDADYAYHVYSFPAPTAPVILTGTLGPMMQDVSFSQQFTALGAAATWSGTDLPDVLNITADGLLSGTPTGSGDVTFTITATNAHGSDSRQFTLTIAAAPTPPTITTTTLADMQQGRSVSVTLAADGTEPLAWSATAGALPDGVTLSGAGVLTGSPTTIGTGSVTVTVSGPGGTDDQALSWAVVAATIMEYSVYGDNAPPFTYTTYDDAGVDSWLGEQFTLSDTPERAFQAVGVRVYVPAGSAMIGQTGYIGLVRRAVESSGAYVYGAAIPSPGPGGNGSKTAMATPLVEGWNDFYLDTPQAANSGDALVACIALRGYYLFGAGPHEEIESADTNLFLVDAASYQRTFYASDGLGGMGVSSAIDYGLDIIVRET